MSALSREPGTKDFNTQRKTLQLEQSNNNRASPTRKVERWLG